jgi:hypothetical protein
MTRNEVRPTANTEWRGSTISLRFASVQSWTMRGGAETASDPGANDSRGRYPQSAPLQNGLGVARLWGRRDGRRRPRFSPRPTERLPTFCLCRFLAKVATGLRPLWRIRYHLAACLWKRSSTDSKADRDIQVESLLKRALAAVDPQIMAMRISNSEFRRPLSASTLKQPKNVRGAQNNSRLCQYSLPSRASLSAVWQLCPRTRGVRQLRAAQ